MPKRLIIALCLLLAEVAVLKALPATSAHLIFTDAPDVTMSKGRVTLGPMVWDLQLLSTTPALDAYRAFYTRVCPATIGLRAAICVSEALAAAFPEDTPKHEMVEADYDPTATLQAHLGGEPGHCVTRSALAATTLLSMGIPARVVQLQAQDGLGHYAFEVLADDVWLLIDPTAGSTHVSAHTLIQRADPGQHIKAPKSDNQARFEAFYAGELVGGMLLYPEPWLYTRIGDHASSWPYRGTWALAGRLVPWTMAKLAIQWILLPLTLLLALAALLLWRVRVRKSP